LSTAEVDTWPRHVIGCQSQQQQHQHNPTTNYKTLDFIPHILDIVVAITLLYSGTTVDWCIAVARTDLSSLHEEGQLYLRSQLLGV
jgi:hypothetical protein